jgi:hypothetical protein
VQKRQKKEWKQKSVNKKNKKKSKSVKKKWTLFKNGSTMPLPKKSKRYSTASTSTTLFNSQAQTMRPPPTHTRKNMCEQKQHIDVVTISES